MKRFASLFLLFLFISPSSFSQDEASMKAWTDYKTPSAAHKHLATMAGEWTAILSWYMDPSLPPTMSEGVATQKMIMDGLYLHSENKSSMMGMPLDGLSITGYDNAKGIYFNTWIDNSGSGIMYSEGKMDEKTKVLTLKGKMYEPMSAQDLTVRSVYTFLTADKYKYEMFVEMPSGEMKMMEIEFNRKK